MGARDEETAMRGHAWNTERGPFGERHIVWERRHEVGGEGNVFSSSTHPTAITLAVMEPDTAADPCGVHTRTYLVDCAGAVTVRDYARIFDGGMATATTVAVRGVYPESVQAHTNLPERGFGSRELPDSQYLPCRALLIIPDGAHRSSSRGVVGILTNIANTSDSFLGSLRSQGSSSLLRPMHLTCATAALAMTAPLSRFERRTAFGDMNRRPATRSTHG
jgi:hypothetical protein